MPIKRTFAATIWCGMLLVANAALGQGAGPPPNYQNSGGNYAPNGAPNTVPTGYPAYPNMRPPALRDDQQNMPPNANPHDINRALNPNGPPPDGKPQENPQLVVDVQILGIEKSREHTVQKYLHTRRDKEFDPEMVQGDVRRLVSSGQFRDVRTYTRPAANGIIVIYEIFERPRIKYIKHIGNRDAGEKKLAKEHALKVGDPLNAYNAEEGRRKIEEWYHKNGHPKAQVSIMEGDKPNDKGLVYYINEGNLERIETVSFRGNTVASDQRLKTQIESKPGWFYYFFGGKVDRAKLDSDVEKLTAYYRRLGYFRARVARELDMDESGKWVTLTFVIDEGPRYVVRSVKIEGVANFPEAPLLGFMDIKAGEYFHQDKMNKDITTLTDLYGSKGFVFADVQADPRFLEEPGQIDLVYRVKEGEVFHIGDINVHVGGEYPHTRDAVVLVRSGLMPGDLADMRKIRDWERRLKSSQLFETNPQQGDAPRVALGTPSVGNAANIAKGKGSNGPTIRGQSPDYGPPHRAPYVPQPLNQPLYQTGRYDAPAQPQIPQQPAYTPPLQFNPPTSDFPASPLPQNRVDFWGN
ncbi:BamA/OMP85 family outer membrane protein [Anatilimnocola floriformis]|uniref:BamA/OMP85 family outer membrane protein n=1 Tax=Anatilimnocola floriformis TaxID=2948575 RepID=UPI0020C4DD0D|nr:POTRA domain-containing protein [Anatilimnocola floriformis]